MANFSMIFFEATCETKICRRNEQCTDCKRNFCNTFSCANPAGLFCKAPCIEGPSRCMCKPGYRRSSPRAPCKRLRCTKPVQPPVLPPSKWKTLLEIEFANDSQLVCPFTNSWNQISIRKTIPNLNSKLSVYSHFDFVKFWSFQLDSRVKPLIAHRISCVQHVNHAARLHVKIQIRFAQRNVK